MYLSIDIGATKTLLGTFNVKGNNLEQVKLSTPGNFSEFISQLKKAASGLNLDGLQAVGVGVPGVVDSQGTVIKLGNLKWTGAKISAVLSEHFNCAISVANDADLAGLAEASMGAGSEYSRVLYVTISTGVGTGLIIDRQIAGPSEGGHMVLDYQAPATTLENLVSGPALKRRFNKYGYEITDPQVWDKIARELAVGLYNMFTLFTPEIIVLGGGVATHYNLFGTALIKHFETFNPGFYPTPVIKPAQNPETAAFNGGYLLARQNFSKKPQS